MRTLRRNALEKLAVLSAKCPTSSTGTSDLARMCKRCPKSPFHGMEGGSDVSRVPMGLPELDVLLAVCKAAPLVREGETAERLLHQLSLYLPESHIQTFSSSPDVRDLDRSPWELLTFNLTSALLSLGLNHAALRSKVAATVDRYVHGWVRVAGSMSAEQFERDTDDRDHELSRMVILSLSLLGFLEAASTHAWFWTSHEILRLIGTLRGALSERLMIGLETALSVIRSGRSMRAAREWKRSLRHYAVAGRPMGAMLLQHAFMRLVVAAAALMVATPEEAGGKDIVDVLRARDELQFVPVIRSDQALVEGLVDIAADEIRLLEDGSDYLRIGSAWQQRLSSAVKGSSLTTFLCCSIVNDEVADPEVLTTWLDQTLNDPVQISDDVLASVVLKCMVVLAKSSPVAASNLSKMLSQVIAQGDLDSRTSGVAAESLASILKLLTQDGVITTLYGLGNIITAGAFDRTSANMHALDGTNHSKLGNGTMHPEAARSAISLAPGDGEEPSAVYAGVIRAIVGVAASCKDDKITALAQSMLIQKVGRVNANVDAQIITESGILGVYSAPAELRSLLKLYTKICHDALANDNQLILEAVKNARNHLSRGIKRTSPLYEVYMVHMLDSIISKGDAHEHNSHHLANSEFAAKEIGQMLEPCSILVAENAEGFERDLDSVEVALLPLMRDAWFNIVVHGFTLSSPLGAKHGRELRILARASRPLIAEDRGDQLESDVELNTVLRRGKTPEHAVEQKRRLIEVLPSCESDIKSLSYAEVVFLNAANLVENLRAGAGDCTKALHYFLDSELRSGAMGNCMAAIAHAAVITYLSRTLRGEDYAFSAPFVARQLATIFAGCCHRISRVQEVATHCADVIINKVPSALCQQSSLFALLELLTIMWASCLERDTDEYEWTSRYTSSRENVSVELSDNFEFRQLTLIHLHKLARDWVVKVLNISPLDIKGLLQSYLAEFHDEGAYGHVALGRSFALEMGSAIPSTDQRLGAIERPGDLTFDAASDFIAQYTTRQEYRFVDGIQDQDHEWTKRGADRDPLMRGRSKLDLTMEDAATLLADVESRTLRHKHVSVAELRDVLRRAAALLCRVKRDHCTIVHHLVGVPFAVFSKQSIKLGISLWMSVIKENPRMESRILVEIAECWEATVRKKQGLFSERFNHPDPFYVKMEFAPSDKDVLMKKQQLAYNLIGPHFRLLQFLSSHFNATRLASPHLQKVYHRLLHITLDAMRLTTNNPLARETHFHVVLLGFKVLQHSTHINRASQWQLKDRILSAALSWFRFPPRWSFGGNRIQIKAEAHLLADVQAALHSAPTLGVSAEPAFKSLQGKQDLLDQLLSSEQTRLMVWLFPLDYEKRHHFTSGQHHRIATDTVLSGLLKVAWAEDPALAVQLVSRFQSQRLTTEARQLVLSSPQSVLGEADALELMLGSSLPNDVAYQLKYLLYWAPVNPMTATTYFLPAYGNHPFIIQYAMRALESHSVDVTFFYVPQIVQALRYDVLEYVERYIIETAKFSQLFAHQIIWNMKANAFKDEDSQIPDPVKPMLDKVTTSLISSFSQKDRSFYEREFDFFNEVTDISGKLRPFIKKSKPEKKQKIEEELRKIKVDVGVYLPSNPDGVVIGIDRKSGKPLQSHAKAPYMATFRIRKEKTGVEGVEENGSANGDMYKEKDSSYEIWQSAIFKVGDDCRQDVLALQMIAAFRGIFNNVGLDVFVNPYRVTATAPGCGVIDVLPNSISRDMLGREAVNGLYDYFASKYGGEDCIRFQEARNHFVKSMAAYSVISYLLQFKDRHNGNIMIDDAGHILHIDFGFCFDIAPGGIKFERAPFKLTSEMVAVMGGSTDSQAYRWFEELCIKAFLASRPHCEHLAHIVLVMLDSGLPCFKPETIPHFRDRFVLDKSDRDAADFMRDLIRKSHGSKSTYGYDQFQLMTNGIPF